MQLKEALATRAPYLIFIGEEELDNGTVTNSIQKGTQTQTQTHTQTHTQTLSLSLYAQVKVKHVATEQQVDVARADLVDFFNRQPPP